MGYRTGSGHLGRGVPCASRPGGGTEPGHIHLETNWWPRATVSSSPCETPASRRAGCSEKGVDRVLVHVLTQTLRASGTSARSLPVSELSLPITQGIVEPQAFSCP